jgi:hypothetical protein
MAEQALGDSQPHEQLEAGAPWLLSPGCSCSEHFTHSMRYQCLIATNIHVLS